MPHRNGHTAIEMSPKPHRRYSRSPSHDSPNVHAGPLDQPHGRTLSPHADRSHHGSRGNVSHGSHGSHGNIHTSSGNNLNVHNNGGHHSTHSAPSSNGNLHIPSGSHGNLHNATGSHASSLNNLNHDDTSQPHSRHRRDAPSSAQPITTTTENSPLLETDTNERKPPLAGPEIDDLDDEKTVPAPASGQPGVDDGFYNSEDETAPEDRRETDDEGDGDHTTHNHRKLSADGSKSDPGDGGSTDDEADGLVYGNYPLAGYPTMGSRSNFGDPNGVVIASRFDPNTPFPMSPEFMPGAQPRVIPDVNVYQQKKNLAQGMMDLALLSANANQLRYVLEAGDFHPYFYASMIFISASLILQIAVGVGLIVNSTYDVKDRDDICKADKINNFTVVGIFLITVVNVFIASFGVAQYPTAPAPIPAPV